MRSISAPEPRHGWWLAGIIVLGAVSQAVMVNKPATTLPEITVSASLLPQDPSVLSDKDISLYKMIFASQDRGDYRTADAMLSELQNTQLMGHVLAERYLAKNYHADHAELKEWLTNYADHPQANRINGLAHNRGVNVDVTANENPLRGLGYTDHLGRTTMSRDWYRALGVWREKNYVSAKSLFAKVGHNDTLSNWQRAAGYYWAYRAANKLGNKRDAYSYLAQAGEFPTTFYGLLANQQTGSVLVSARAPHVSGDLRHDARAVRAGLLAQLSRNDGAEDELRHLYSASDEDQRPGIVTLASEMGLANLQVRLSTMPQLSAEEAIFAKYPTPQFMVGAQHVIDPALLLAIARNESSFREIATSTGGAVGMMQMLPSTARAVERHIGRDSLALASNDSNAATRSIAERLSDPAMSVRFGAQYLKLLTKEPAIGNNLIRLLAGYNAGPGTVAGWQAAAKHIDDPLLYIESIPYPETHNYVLQVMAQYWIYQSLLGEPPASLTAISRGHWPQVQG